jgi:hypothetical protein
MTIRILDEAEQDLIDGYFFYEKQLKGLGGYFLDSLYSDIDSLLLYAGIHVKFIKYFKMLSKRFPYAVFYTIDSQVVYIWAVLDCRQDPLKVIDRL